MPTEWTAHLDSVTKDRGNVVATVTFVSADGERVTDTIRADTLTFTTIREFCGRRIRSLQTRDAAYPSFDGNAGKTVDPIYPEA